MALHKRTAIDPLLKDISGGTHKQVYLFYGERFLCHQAADQIESALVETSGGTIHKIDGSAEEDSKILSRLLSFSLLPGLQIYRVGDSRLFLSRSIGSDIWDKAVKAHENKKEKPAATHLAGLLNIGNISEPDQSVFSNISPGQWQKLFGFSHPETDLSWADRLIGENPTLLSSVSAEDVGQRLCDAVEQGFPAANILILTAENVDKRKKLFLQIKKYGEIIDCSVAGGASRAAVREQEDVIKEMALKTLTEFHKTIEPNAMKLLFERVGFHPVAVVMEMEKLALYVDKRPRITVDDLNLMVSRTKEDAVFELTEALAARELGKSLTILNNLLSDGVHSLAVLASLRNYLRKLLVFRSIQSSGTPPWRRGMAASEFQNSYLPALKETGEWPDLLKGHPYALFMSFNKAAEFTAGGLKRSLSLLLDAEFKLKGSPIPHNIVLEELLISLTKVNRAAPHRI